MHIFHLPFGAFPSFFFSLTNFLETHNPYAVCTTSQDAFLQHTHLSKRTQNLQYLLAVTINTSCNLSFITNHCYYSLRSFPGRGTAGVARAKNEGGSLLECYMVRNRDSAKHNEDEVGKVYHYVHFLPAVLSPPLR